jgi:hypothetical protein
MGTPAQLVSSTTPNAPLIDMKTGQTVWAWVKWFQGVALAINNTLAPLMNPVFTGVVTQPSPPVLTGAKVDTNATSGSATALPAMPAGYLEQSINGVVYKVPFYDL